MLVKIINRKWLCNATKCVQIFSGCMAKDDERDGRHTQPHIDFWLCDQLINGLIFKIFCGSWLYAVTRLWCSINVTYVWDAESDVHVIWQQPTTNNQHGPDTVSIRTWNFSRPTLDTDRVIKLWFSRSRTQDARTNRPRMINDEADNLLLRFIIFKCHGIVCFMSIFFFIDLIL